MTVEYIRYQIAEENRRSAFFADYAAAAESLKSSPNCLSYEMCQCDEDAASFILRIEWDSTQGHLEGFRKSSEFRAFYQAVSPYVADIKEMRHYSVTSIRGGK